jgi:poly(3-hydroxyalkanoate) synthetase
MREAPFVDNKVLRKHQESYLPQFQHLSAKKLIHFRRSIFNRIFKNGTDVRRNVLHKLQNSMNASNPSYLEYCDIVDEPIMRRFFLFFGSLFINTLYFAKIA